MRKVDPVRVGLLIDYAEEGRDTLLEDIVLATFRLVAEELRADGTLDREVEFIVEQVRGLPEGRFNVVREAFFRLVARRVLDDGSGIVMHGTIEGLVAPYEAPLPAGG